jgi:hypothetical protein
MGKPSNLIKSSLSAIPETGWCGIARGLLPVGAG